MKKIIWTSVLTHEIHVYTYYQQNGYFSIKQGLQELLIYYLQTYWFWNIFYKIIWKYNMHKITFFFNMLTKFLGRNYFLLFVLWNGLFITVWKGWFKQNLDRATGQVWGSECTKPIIVYDSTDFCSIYITEIQTFYFYPMAQIPQLSV